MSAERVVRHAGRLLYRKISTGLVRGREDWALTENVDGTTTMRCLASTDDSRFVRDAIYTIDGDRQPRDLFVRLQVAERTVGTGYFRRHGDRLSVVTDRADEGRDVEEVEIPPRFHIVTHAVMLDGWTLSAYDFARGGRQTVTVYNTSTRWDGTDGPLGRLETMTIEPFGEEEAEVPAGRFRAFGFTLESDTMNSPICRLWVAGEERVLVRYDWPDFDLEYVLDRWEREE